LRKSVKDIKNYYKILDGKIVYSDLTKSAKVFFSNRYKITGKPDYIVIKNDRYIPVEFKAGRNNVPQKSHIYQLATYCSLIEENYGCFVPYGVLVYNMRYQFKIPFDPKIRFELEKTLKIMRMTLKTGKIYRNHNVIFKCNNCSMRNNCNYKLT
jgi:CRISPR-associated exonuclease Cas4